jgi:hypothetical protein
MRHCNRCRHRPLLTGLATLYAIVVVAGGAAAFIYAFARSVGAM